MNNNLGRGCFYTRSRQQVLAEEAAMNKYVGRGCFKTDLLRIMLAVSQRLTFGESTAEVPKLLFDEFVA